MGRNGDSLLNSLLEDTEKFKASLTEGQEKEKREWMEKKLESRA